MYKYVCVQFFLNIFAYINANMYVCMYVCMYVGRHSLPNSALYIDMFGLGDKAS